jgi:hypothetical protein
MQHSRTSDKAEAAEVDENFYLFQSDVRQSIFISKGYTINNVVGQIVLGQLEYGMVHIRPYVNTGIKKFDHGVLVWHGRYGIQYSMVCHISLTIQCHGMVRCRYMVLGDMVWYGI